MLKKQAIATLLAMSLSSIPNATFPAERSSQEHFDASIFNPLITKHIQTIVDDYNKKEQERLAYEEWLKQEEYKRLNPEFPKYNLTEDELIQITRLCYQEQGSLEGIAAEASLIANKNEISNQNESKNIVNYLANCGWFANASYFMNNGQYTKEGLEIVRAVLVEGKRTLPKYIDEHDSISDVSYNTDVLIPYETKVKNVYGGAYTYYDSPGTSDTFGYTNEALREKYGDAHYEFERLLER